MSTSLAAAERRELAAAPIDSFLILDVHAAGLVAPRKQQETLATISAGYLQPGRSERDLPRPVVSRDGTIYINGHQQLAQDAEAVPGLVAALERSGRKRLTIAFPFDDPALFIQQRFARRSATRLELYGDHRAITRIEVRQQRTQSGREVETVDHVSYPAGTREYADLVAACKVETSVYFLLAEWDGQTPRVVMPDGAGLYRLRMTGRNSVQGIVNSLRWMAQLTQGRIAGIPFELFLDYRDVAAPNGVKRNIPVWQLVMRPPETLALTTGNFRDVLHEAIEQGERLKALPAPPTEVLEGAFRDVADVDLDEPTPAPMPTPSYEDMLLAEKGGPCDAEFHRKRWFAVVRGTALDDADARADFIHRHTQGATASLGEFLRTATDAEAAALTRAAFVYLNPSQERDETELERVRAERRAAADAAGAEAQRRYREWTPTTEDQAPPPDEEDPEEYEPGDMGEPDVADPSELSRDGPFEDEDPLAYETRIRKAPSIPALNRILEQVQRDASLGVEGRQRYLGMGHDRIVELTRRKPVEDVAD